MEAYGLPAPVFENRRDEFVATLYNTPVATDTIISSPNTTDTLLDFCKTPLSRKEIADFLKLKMANPEHPGNRTQKYYS